MKKKKITLNETQLRNMIKESIQSVFYNMKNRPSNMFDEPDTDVYGGKWQDYFNKISDEVNHYIYGIPEGLSLQALEKMLDYKYGLIKVFDNDSVKEYYRKQQEPRDFNHPVKNIYPTGDNLATGWAFFTNGNYGKSTSFSDGTNAKKGLLVTYKVINKDRNVSTAKDNEKIITTVKPSIQ